MTEPKLRQFHAIAEEIRSRVASIEWAQIGLGAILKESNQNLIEELTEWRLGLEKERENIGSEALDDLDDKLIPELISTVSPDPGRLSFRTAVELIQETRQLEEEIKTKGTDLEKMKKALDFMTEKIDDLIDEK